MHLTPVSSSQIEAIGYDPQHNKLRVKFHSGGTYEYSNVPEDLHHKIMSAKSQGSEFHRLIKPHKDKYPYIKLP